MTTETTQQPTEGAFACSALVGDDENRGAKNGVGGGAELSAAMQDALADMKRHGDTEFKYYRRHRGLMQRAEWRDDTITAEAPRLVTIGALLTRGLIEEYHEVKYCGHGEYDDWACWRLVAAGGEDARSHEGDSLAVRSPLAMCEAAR